MSLGGGELVNNICIQDEDWVYLMNVLCEESGVSSESGI